MFIRMVVVLFITLYTTRVILAVLGVEDYGIYNVVCGFVSMFSFLNTSMSNGIQRFFNFELGNNGTIGAQKVFNNALFIQIILAILVLFLTETLGLWYLHNKMVIPEPRFTAAKWIYQFSVINFLLVIFQSPFGAAIMAHEKMGFYATINILDTVLKLVIVYILPKIDVDRLIMYGIFLCLISGLNLLLSVIYCRIYFQEIKASCNLDKQLMKSMLSFSGWNIFGSFSIIMKDQGINLILNLFFGPIVNAARGIAVQINSGINSFVSNITIPVRPQLVQSYSKGNISRALSLTYSVCKLSSMCYFMIAFPICLEIRTVLEIWLGDNIPMHSESFVVLTLITAFTSNFHSAISNLVHATGQMKKFQLTTSIIKLISIPLSYALLSLYMVPEAAFVIVLVLDIIAHFCGCYILSRITYFPLIQYIRTVILPVLNGCFFASIPAILLHFLLGKGIMKLLLILSSTILSMTICGYFLTFDNNEKEMFVYLFKSLITKRK